MSLCESVLCDVCFSLHVTIRGVKRGGPARARLNVARQGHVNGSGPGTARHGSRWA